MKTKEELKAEREEVKRGNEFIGGLFLTLGLVVLATFLYIQYFRG